MSKKLLLLMLLFGLSGSPLLESSASADSEQGNHFDKNGLALPRMINGETQQFDKDGLAIPHVVSQPASRGKSGKDFMRGCPGPACPATIPYSEPPQSALKSASGGKSGKDFMRGCPGPACPATSFTCEYKSEVEIFCEGKRYVRDARSISDKGNSVQKVLKNVLRSSEAHSIPSGDAGKAQ